MIYESRRKRCGKGMKQRNERRLRAAYSERPGGKKHIGEFDSKKRTLSHGREEGKASCKKVSSLSLS